MNFERLYNMIPIVWHSGKGKTVKKKKKKNQWFPGVWEGEMWIVKT